MSREHERPDTAPEAEDEAAADPVPGGAAEPGRDPSPETVPGDGAEPGDEPGVGSPDATPGPGPGAEGDTAGLEADLAALRAELADAEARLQRSQADFANYRRRMMAEQERWGDRAVARLAVDLLPVADNLERALGALAAATSPGVEAFREGIELTLRQFHDVLAKHDIRPIEAVGRPFDPRVHEAVGQVETDAVPEDHVAAELQRGYTFKDDVLRPSLVQVARTPAHPDSPQTDASDEEGSHHGQGRGD